MTTTSDYDSDPDRFRTGTRVTAAHLRPGVSLYEKIAGLLTERGVRRVLDLGCGEGALGAAVGTVFGSVFGSRFGTDAPLVVGLDTSSTMLSAVAPPVTRADATAIPFRDNVFDAVVAVNVLDHLPDPLPAVRAAHRVLRPGGVLVAGAISRRDSPELAPVWRPEPTPFDAEDAPDIVASVFGEADVDGWDAPLMTLPDTTAITDYLIARFVPAERAAVAARGLPAPLVVTKRGTLVIGHKA
ncbi:class I SAM-dependent methyltransferase [Actinophytocola sp.]|uniref:class I SAM-dependent methyltransferase n=1 Tax=Actinophytocola sp. TaxID=1872138 RepID=UPI003D6C23CA